MSFCRVDFPEPVRPKEAVPSLPQSTPPTVPQVRTFNETQRGALLEALTAAPGLHYVHRAANLEDVFIKLTGRELRD